MKLIDKDLMSMQEVRELVESAKEAQRELARMDQAQVDRIVKSIADAGVRNAKRLAQMAQEDTGFGVVSDKVVKNVFASRGVYEHIKDMKTIGEIERDDAKGLRKIAVPVGVIAGLIPSTNPTSTAFYKSEIAIKSGNAIVFSPHPTALRAIMETVKVIRQAIAEAGANENLVSCISIPTMEATSTLMHHREHRSDPCNRRFRNGKGSIFIRNTGNRCRTGKWSGISGEDLRPSSGSKADHGFRDL